jgi:hypothetical protein
VRAGSAVRVTAIVVHQDGTPLPGQSVVFDIDAGKLDGYRMVTDSGGRATVTWTAPTRLRDIGGSHLLRLLTQLPDGTVATTSLTLTVSPGPPVRVQFYQQAPGTLSGWRPLGATETFASGYYYDIYAMGWDEYGNLSADPAPALSLFRLSGGPLYNPWLVWSCSDSGFGPEQGSATYRFCYSRMFAYLYYAGTFRLVAQTPGGVSAQLEFTVR